MWSGPWGEVDAYDPEQGLKAVAVAEAAEKHFARAKDSTKLYEAITAKLGEQRRFVLWFDDAKRGDLAGNQRPVRSLADTPAEDSGRGEPEAERSHQGAAKNRGRHEAGSWWDHKLWSDQTKGAEPRDLDRQSLRFQDEPRRH